MCFVSGSESRGGMVEVIVSHHTSSCVLPILVLDTTAYNAKLFPV